MPDSTSFDHDAERRQKQLADLDRLAQRFGASLSSAFARNVQEGRRLDEVLERLGRSLLNVTLRAAMKPLKSGLEALIRSALSAASSAGDGAGGTDAADAAAAALAKGGVVSRGQVMPFAKGGVVAAPTYFPLARGMGLMGEAGSEAVMPLARGPDGRLGVRSAGDGARAVQVTVNIATPDADSFRRSEAQVAAALARAVARGRRGL